MPGVDQTRASARLEERRPGVRPEDLLEGHDIHLQGGQPLTDRSDSRLDVFSFPKKPTRRRISAPPQSLRPFVVGGG